MPTRNTMLDARQRQGTVTSASRVPEASSDDFTVEVGMQRADIVDATNSMQLALEGSFDSGATWQLLVAATWSGGEVDRDGNPIPPSISTVLSGLRPDQVRVRCDIPRRQLMSADIVEDSAIQAR